MNTANMLEFDIGGFDTDDVINVNLSVGKLNLKDIRIKYRAMVQIIDRGKTAKQQYSTFASIELRIPETKYLTDYILPECTTRLFFYDDVIYISGVNDWSVSSKEVYYTGKGLFGNKKYDKVDVFDAQFVEVAYTVDELMYMISNDMNKFLDEFLYYLLPLTKKDLSSLFFLNIRNEIASGISKPAADNTDNTLAKIFKSYNYDGSAHKIVMGLAELTGSSMLSDLSITIAGANDGDSNIMDNYIQSLSVSTDMLGGLMSMNIIATLHNTDTPVKYYDDVDFTTPSQDNEETDFYRNELESTGLGTINIAYDKKIFTYKNESYERNGSSGNFCLNEGDNNPVKINPDAYSDLDVNGIINTLLAQVVKDNNGKVLEVNNRPNCPKQWVRAWKDAYEAAQEAA